jgi:hypothetical protein
VDKQTNLSLGDPGKTKSVTGREKFTFLYGALSTVALTWAILYSMMTGLTRTQSVLVSSGSVLVACAAAFFLLEVRRMAGGAKGADGVNPEPNLYVSRNVPVAPTTGEPYPHHEEFAESAGFDQGQLTARIPDSTPFVEDFLSRRPRTRKA